MSERRYTSEEIARLYENHTPEEIASITEWKLWRIYATLHKQQVEIRPQGRETFLESPGKEYLISLQKHGLSQQNIADRHGVSKHTVQRWLGEEE